MSATAWHWDDYPPLAARPFEVVIERDVPIAMRDGVRLSADVYRPASDGEPVPGRHPALLHRTPYDKGRSDAGYGRFFASHGYVAVVQDVRGTYASEGELDLLVDEAVDGADTLAWIDTQGWSDGTVGMWGTSYASFTQLAAATQGPTNLRAMVPCQSASAAWHSSMRHNGAFELRWLAWAFWHAAMNCQTDLHAEPWVPGALALGAPTTSDWLTRLPVRAGATQLKLVPNYERWLLRLLQHTDETGIWQGPSLAPIRYLDRFPPASILLVGGWYDSYARSSVELYDAMAGKDHLDVSLLMGPWVHGATAPESGQAGDVDLGAEAAIRDFRELHLRWFDRTLRGIGSRGDEQADAVPVRLFVMGGGSGQRTAGGLLTHGGRWRRATSWPPEGVRSWDLHLHPDGRLDAAIPAEGAASTTYRFDPDRPVPSIGGNVSSLSELLPLPQGVATADDAGGSKRRRDVLLAGGFDQVESPEIHGCEPPYLPLASRADVLVFRSEALDHDIEVTGPVRVRLYISTTVTDTDVTAKLIDEYPASHAYPHGYALNLTDSIQRLRYRDGSPAREVTPGDIMAIEFDLYPTSNLFGAGHRIRLDVSSSNFPRFDVNPNTGELLGTERRRIVADTTLHHDAMRPSVLQLMVMPTH